LPDGEGPAVMPCGRKSRAIIAILAAHPSERVSRQRLVDLLWSDRGEAQARGSLRQSLLEIRRAAPGLISGDHQQVWIDGARLAENPSHSNAKDGDLFADLEGVSPEFDEWKR
jgi:DNA-binding SARP family transcriptional activator